MGSPFDQNTEQEPSSQQSYERNLSRDYAPSERAKVRALDQRAAFNEATLKQRAEIAGANAEIAKSRLGLADQRAGIDQIRIQIAEEKAELANNDSKAKAMRELTVTREANGFLRDAIGMDPNKLEFDEQYQKMLAGYQNAPESKAVQEWITAHVPIAKSRKEREDLIAKEKRATDEKIAAGKRAADAAETERTRLQKIAKDIPISQVVSDGVTYKKPDLPKPKEEIPDTYVKYAADLAAARKSLGIPVASDPEKQIPLPFDIQKQFEARGTALTKDKATLPPTEQPQATVGNPSGMPTPAAPAAPSVEPAAPAAPGGTSRAVIENEVISRNAFLESQRRYPALRDKDSAENIEYIRAYRNLRGFGATEFFSNPEWPIVLAEELAKRDGWKRSDKPAGKTDSITPEEYNAPRPVVTESKQYASEEDARKNGAKAGDIIILINPATGKPGRARLD